ncbi:MAG: protocatechuate 3,4-dioxygenase subunit alpha [Chloroflexi bacterium]|nr:protocatechuate 3,4-dioxygenase subunit alpha [Chloroflexota bacterium]
MTALPTPSQTVGPFFAIMTALGSNELVAPGAPGAMEIHGQVFDGAGDPVGDALIELWQANRAGRYAHPADDRELLLDPDFTGWGRCHTRPDGSFRFITVKPGPVPGDGEVLQAPHINVSVFARGLLNRLATRIYFGDEARANAADPVLVALGDDARESLIAAPDGPSAFRFDIRLQGERETAFFAI